MNRSQPPPALSTLSMQRSTHPCTATKRFTLLGKWQERNPNNLHRATESDQDNRRSIDHDNRWDGGFHGQDRRTDQVPVASLCSGSALRHQFRIQGTSLLNA